MPPSYDKIAAERAAQAAVDYKAGPAPGPAFRKAMQQDDNASDISDRTDRDVVNIYWADSRLAPSQ